jgi:hypothetical protein
MNTLRTAAAILALAFSASACTSGSQIAPRPGAAVAPFRAPSAFRLTTRPKPEHRALFFSGNVTGNVDLYDVSGNLLGECGGCGGWGLAATRKGHELAIGAFGGVVTVWHVSAPFVPIATLGLSSRAKGTEALGLAFDESGDLFAGNYPANTIDEFTAATIASGGGEPDATFALRQFAEVHYLAAAGPHLLVDGWDQDYNFVVADVGVRGLKAHTTIVQTLGSMSAGTGYPGGLAADAKDNLLVDNQYAGTISTFAEPWTGRPTSTLAWGYGPNDYTGIALDPLGQIVWAANIYTASSSISSFGVANSYPLGTILSTTAPPVNDRYVGVAAVPFDR